MGIVFFFYRCRGDGVGPRGNAAGRSGTVGTAGAVSAPTRRHRPAAIHTGGWSAVAKQFPGLTSTQTHRVSVCWPEPPISLAADPPPN